VVFEEVVGAVAFAEAEVVAGCAEAGEVSPAAPHAVDFRVADAPRRGPQLPPAGTLVAAAIAVPRLAAVPGQAAAVVVTVVFSPASVHRSAPEASGAAQEESASDNVRQSAAVALQGASAPVLAEMGLAETVGA
jgi:hypothetical protein